MSNKLVAFSILAMLLFGYTFSSELSRSIAETELLFLNGLAAVGATASVEKNRYSDVVAQITDKQQELEEREAALIAAENKLRERENRIIPIEWYVTALAFILLVLVLLNFYLDWKREQQPA